MIQPVQAESSLILTPKDFLIIDLAMQAAEPTRVGRSDDGHREAVGKAVIRLYTAGMTDPTRLADAASTMAATRLLDRRRGQHAG
ncbi:MAG: hypothetical protein H2043_14555 [Rhizobiales bacterium]|nr:hypothetical protein [Hyphomicrobiales bacterium]